ncbi:hypothetical protein FHL15_010670, partial [Xylaria flabelliformis]
KYFFPDPNLEQRIAYCKFWQGKLADNKDIEFPNELCEAIAEITDKFSFAYMQEAFVAALLAIARRSKKGGDRRFSQEPRTRDVGDGWLDVCDSGDDDHGDLDDLPLWIEIKKQIETLREALNDKWCDYLATFSPFSEPISLRDPREYLIMCQERYKGYADCKHLHPQSTVIKPKQCAEFIATGRCTQGKKYVFVPEGDMPLCQRCLQLVSRLMDAIGRPDDKCKDSTWELWHRIGWPYEEALVVLEGTLIARWIVIFEEFKDWLRQRLEKRNSQGRLYFPPGEGKKVLQHLVGWTLLNMAQGQFNKLNIAVFREGLDMAFNNLIYEWDTHFAEEPCSDCAKEEFTKYWTDWTNWLRKGDKTLTQGGDKSSIEPVSETGTEEEGSIGYSHDLPARPTHRASTT